MQNLFLSCPFRSHLIGQNVRDEEILFVEFYLRAAANESDGTALLKKNILNGNLRKFQVVTIFDVLEGMYFNLVLFIFLFFCYIVFS